MKQVKKTFGILLSLIVFSLLITGTASAEERVNIVLDWTVNTNHTGLYVALENGYFMQEGVDAHIQFPPQTGAAALVLSGKAEFAVSYQEEITHARASGTPLKALAGIIQHNTSSFASRKSANILRPKDFEGKRYGGWGSPMEEAMLRALMKKDGGDFSKIKILSIGDMDFFAATEKNVDFTWIFDGWDGVAANLKGIPINTISLAQMEKALDYYTPLIAAKDDFLEQKPELAKKCLAAISKGYAFCIRHPEEAAEILLKHAPELDRNLIIASQKYLADKYQADAGRWGEMKRIVWERFAEWMGKYGLLSGKFEAEKAFTNRFLPSND